MTTHSMDDPLDAEEVNARASALMKLGIRLMEDGDPKAVKDAVNYFGRARDLRRQLPLDESPLFRYGLAASCLNWGDAVVRLGDAARLPEALLAYDEAIEVLGPLPMETDPRYPRRLAMAHHNRGLALDAQGGHAGAVAAFTCALDVLDLAASAAIADRPYLCAVIRMNLARVQAATGADPARAEDAARQAVALSDALGRENADAVEVSIKARYVLCQALVARLSPAADRTVGLEAVHAATDAVDDALDLARNWEARGVHRFRPLAHDLFRFGARVYATFQPQFLREFVEDNLDAARSSPAYVESAEMRAAAEEALGLLGDGPVKPS